MASWRFCKKTSDNSFIIYGRSDATLNPGGVRLGTSEIYSVVEKFIEIKESLVIGQNWNNDIRIVLFIVLKNKNMFSEKLKKRIKSQIYKLLSPRHVPKNYSSDRYSKNKKKTEKLLN